ncbi:tetratricopeptide repeat protein 7B-like [Hibiscus syriacus]|uniref:Tetratricopeptide repeat protein 7B-like n=1 Tax=Hibiscus syriacus TaxID=106335 RepID=A0A6A2Z0Z1_HIBSY|nr:tetratricopeptide repeat protein 7B-like [Hibiscus syriacus]
MEDEAEIYDGIRAQFPLTFDSLRNSKSPNPNPSDSVIGPPRPPSGPVPDYDDDYDVMVGPPPPPPGSGEHDDNDAMIGPARPPVEPSLDSGEEEEEENRYRIPMSNEIILKGHTKIVSALAIDHSGSRVLSGSFDYTVRMFDFQGMNSRLQLEPFEGHQVRNLSWSSTSDRFLCVTGSAQAKIDDRDGLTLGRCIAGGVGDGSIQIWTLKPGWGSRPNYILKKAILMISRGLSFLAMGKLCCLEALMVHSRDQPSRKRQREKIPKDPVKSHKPELPINGPGHGGRVGSTKGSLLTRYLLKQGGMIKETWMEEDPREAILKYADVAVKDPKFIAPAYSQTQPEPFCKVGF